MLTGTPNRALPAALAMPGIAARHHLGGLPAGAGRAAGQDEVAGRLAVPENLDKAGELECWHAVASRSQLVIGAGLLRGSAF
jgi:hypothetical protein